MASYACQAGNGRLLHLQPKGSWAFPAPREFCCCPRAVDRRSRPEGSSKTPEGPEYALEPEGWRCNNDILLP